MDHKLISVATCLLLIVFSSCRQLTEEKLPETASPVKFDEQQAVISLLGKELVPPKLPELVTATRDSLLGVAKTNFDKKPDSEKNIIWYGRRLAYLSQFFAAINIYSEGLKSFPESFRLLRHRGHRFISVRKFDLAIADLSKAARLAEGRPLATEPDGLPNRFNKPLSNTHFNIWYHLGLAYYLQGDYQKAQHSFETSLQFSNNDDLLAASIHWLFMTYSHLKNGEKARQLLKMVNRDMRIIENDNYFKRLLMFKGLLSPDSLLILPGNSQKDGKSGISKHSYGLGHWYLFNGEKEKAMKIFQQVVDGKDWSSFDYIAAEVALAGKAGN